MAKITLSIPDMMCAHCEKRIRGAIEKIGGKLLSLDPENKIIVLDVNVAEAELLKVINEVGYNADII